MRTYTEEDLRNAYRKGSEWGAWNNAGNYFDEPMTEDEYIESLNPQSKEEDKIPMTYGFLRSRIGWETFCDITGIDYYAKRGGYEIKDDEIFYLTESQVKDLI